MLHSLNGYLREWLYRREAALTLSKNPQLNEIPSFTKSNFRLRFFVEIFQNFINVDYEQHILAFAECRMHNILLNNTAIASSVNQQKSYSLHFLEIMFNS